MLTIYEDERGTGYAKDNDVIVARLYKIDNGTLVHMYHDDYEFECGSFNEAHPLIQMRLDRPMEWVN